MKPSIKAIRILETLTIPEGPKAGGLIKLAPLQKKFVRGALADNVNVAVLSIGRGNAEKITLYLHNLQSSKAKPSSTTHLLR